MTKASELNQMWQDVLLNFDSDELRKLLEDRSRLLDIDAQTVTICIEPKLAEQINNDCEIYERIIKEFMRIFKTVLPHPFTIGISLLPNAEIIQSRLERIKLMDEMLEKLLN